MSAPGPGGWAVGGRLHNFCTRARRSSRALDSGGPRIRVMDIVAVILGVVMFGLLFALVAGIDRI
jgi:hypothetical protein